jgi:hypothetical protein
MMGLIMWMMRGHHASQAEPDQPDINTQDEIAVLGAEITALRAQQNRPAEGSADRGSRP